MVGIWDISTTEGRKEYVFIICSNVNTEKSEKVQLHMDRCPESFKSWASDPWPARLYDAAWGHICKLCIYCNNSSSVALQPGVGLGLLYNMPPSLSIPCSISPFVYSHPSQVRGHIIQPSHFWSSSSSCCIQLSVSYLHHLNWLQHGLNLPCAKCQIHSPLSSSGIHHVPRLIVRFRNDFLRGEVVSLTPNPNLEDQGIPYRLGHQLWPVQQGWSYQ